MAMATTASSDRHFISCAGLVKIFQVADLEVVALQGLDLEVSRGEMLALVGPSGSGKSTLMSALGGLDRPTAGRLEVDGQNLLKFSQKELTAYRREQVGFVWQQTTRNLLPYLTARENIELLMRLNGSRQRHKRAWASELLEAVGMTEHANQKPPRLSGGQQQRIAIACALANRPVMLLGDEPTGEVDWATAQRILALLRDLRERYGLTIVMVTHDPRVAEQADRVVAIRDGQTSTERVHVAGVGEAEEPDPSQPSGAAAAPAGPEPEPEPRTFEELVVLDRAGRLQIPGEQRALAKIGRRARVELVEGGILIRPSEDDAFAETPETAGASDSEVAYHSLYRPPEEQEKQPKKRREKGSPLSNLWRKIRGNTRNP
jgi:ABC-type lipoprotein export system ATPase subunit/bifunctional DNA-binding transcriptional regulator/antitoxin component of YhaV-PrlF toxin-antitoxin module